MKIYLFAVLLVSSLFWAACGSDDDGVAGTYDFLSISSTQCDDPDENLTFDLSTDNCQVVQGGIEICVEGTFTLTESGQFTATWNIALLGNVETITTSGSYTVDGNTITICDGVDDCETAIFTAGNDEITLRLPADDDGCIFTLVGKRR